jgi:hypothetical protein
MKIGKKIKTKSIATALALLLVCIACGGALAKYLYENNGDVVVKAADFYFTSDLLDGDTHIFAQGTDTVTFTLENHADKLRYSEMYIDCTVEVKPDNIPVNISYTYIDDNGEVHTVEGENNIIELTLKKGDINNVTGNDITLTLSGLKSGVSYTVTATGDGGYTKTITATIKVQGDTPTVYKYLDTSESEYVLLTVWTKDYQGEIEIEFPDSVIPDNTDKAMRGVKKVDGSFTDTLKDNAESKSDSGYVSHVYRFFRKDDKIGNFIVTYTIPTEDSDTTDNTDNTAEAKEKKPE